MTTYDTSYAGLAATERPGTDPAAPAFLFLHGLTFDRRMWGPILELLPTGHRGIALDLPGHGESPAFAGRGLAAVVDAVQAAVVDAGVESPVVVGHSIGGPIASVHAATHPADGVVSVEAPIRVEPFVAMLRSIAPQLRGTGFDAVWSRLRDSWLMDRIPAPHRELLRAADSASADVVLRYQADLLERPFAEVVRWRAQGMAAVAAKGIPYVCLLANAPDPGDVAWLSERVPTSRVVVWPVEHHFPHLARPALFADLLVHVARDVPTAA